MNNLMRVLPNALTTKTARSVLLSKKHSPTFLFAGGVVGVVATAIVASRATLKLDEVLDEAHTDLDRAKEAKGLNSEKYTEQDYSKDVALIYVRTGMGIVKLYAPAIGVGVLTIAALTSSHKILTGRNAALTAAYAALDRSFRNYRARVTEELGRNADDHFRYGSESKKMQVPDGDGKTVEKKVRIVPPGTPSGYARFFDQGCSSWEKTPEYNLIFLRNQQNCANDMLHARGHVFLNEVYDLLGFERSKPGAVVGWLRNGEGDGYIDFGVFNGDNFKARDFVNGREGSILLDFNVDGTIYDKI